MTQSEGGDKLTSFVIDGEPSLVNFVETQVVKEGVECDIYGLDDDNSKDLAIVRVKKGFKTPLQKVVLGTKTIEGYVQGSGLLTIRSTDQERTYNFGIGRENREEVVLVGEIMQWHANDDEDLVFYEVCEPPYEDGRFENLEDLHE